MDILLELPASIVVFVLGASVGSFLNVVVYRLPAGLSLLYPPSRCPQCLHPLHVRENVPIVGWLWLRGRCHHCHTSISPRYPLVEALTSLLFVLVFWTFGLSWQTIGYWAFFSWLLALALIDLDTWTLPNALTQSGLIAGLAFQAILGALTATGVAGVIAQLMHGVIGAVVGIWLVEIIALAGFFLFKQEAMGAGDAKLAAMMGAWLGWKYLLLAGFLACVVGAVLGVGAIASGRLQHHHRLPFGPALALGSVLVTFWGEAILSAYQQTFAL